MQINGMYCDVKTKAAKPDLSLLLSDRRIIIETDENRHEFYNKWCELGRYDTLQFGASILLPTLCLRFNPHNTNRIKMEFTDRIKVLVQHVRNLLTSSLPADEVPVMSVQYLFYGEVSSTTIKP
jgi:hypothetical protein